MKAASSTRFRGIIFCLVIVALIEFASSILHRIHRTSPDSVADIEQLVSEHPNDIDARLKLGEALLARHRDSEAETEYRSAVGIAPSDARPLNVLAKIAIAHDNTDGALRYLQASLKINPEDPSVWRMYGIALEKRHPKDAWQALCQAVTLDNSPASMLLRSGVTAMEQKQFRQGLFDMEQAAKQNPDDLLTQVELGAAARATDSPTIAAKAYDKALSICPDCVPALIGSAASTLQVDPSTAGFARAAKQLDQVIGVAPSADAYLTRGHLNLMEHKYAAAADDLRTALKIDPRYGTAHSMLYQCYSALGNERLAHEELAIYMSNTAKSKESSTSGLSQ